MAYKKLKSYIDGFVGEYWRIINTNINYAEKTVNFSVVIYKDQATRHDDKKSFYNEDNYNLKVNFREFSKSLKLLTGNEILAEAYNLLPIKESFFEDAQTI